MPDHPLIGLQPPAVDITVSSKHLDALTPIAHSPEEDTTNEAMPDSHTRRRRIAAACALAAAGVFTVAAAPNAPGHDWTALQFTIASSDIGASAGQAPPSCRGMDSRYLLPNGLSKKTAISMEYSDTWDEYQQPMAMKLAAKLHSKYCDSAKFYSSMHAFEDNYYAMIPGTHLYTFYPLPWALQNSNNAPFDDDALWSASLLNLNEPKQLRMAEDIFRLVMSQWDRHGGGIYWQVQLPSTTNHSRAAVSNAPAVLLGIELYRQTYNPMYLREAEKIYGWLNTTLRDPKTGLLFDHITGDKISRHIYTYAQGVNALAEAQLSVIDPEHYSLQNAMQQIRSTIQYTGRRGPREIPKFDSIFYDCALQIATQAHDKAFTKEVVTALKRALQAAPKHPTELGTYAGEVTMSELLKISEDTRNRQLCAAALSKSALAATCQSATHANAETGGSAKVFTVR